MTNFSGAYDLSKLGAPASTASSNANQVRVASLVVACDEQNIRDVLELSAKLPVLVEFHVDSIKPIDFSAMLARLVQSRGGKVLLARVDAQLQQRVAGAFGVQGAPTLIALIGGQPVPLFEGEQDEATVVSVLDQIEKVAASQGLTAVAVVADSNEPKVEDLPPLHQTAFEAISRGDYDAAIAAYERALVENPRDDLAVAGLAQVKLLKRTESIDEATLNSAPPADIAELLTWADAQFTAGNYESAFDALLDAFETHVDERERLKTRLLELFATVESGNESVAKARRRLANLLY